MKKYFVLAALATLALASCSKNIAVEEETPDQLITFQTVVASASTKAMINGNVYAGDAPDFGTIAYYEGTTSNGSVYIPMSKVISSSTSTSTGSIWSTEKAYYWPKTGSLKFYSFSPWTIYDATAPNVTATEADGFTISDYNVASNQDKDVMIATPVTAAQNTTYSADPNNYTGVKTVFNHKLAQVVGFKLQANATYGTAVKATGDKRFFIKKIEINNIPQVGTYAQNASSSESWTETASQTNQNYVFYSNDAGLMFYGTNDAATPAMVESVMIKDAAIAKATDTDKDKWEAPSISNKYLLVLPQSFDEVASGAAASTVQNIKVTYCVESYNGTNWVREDDTVFTKAIKDIHDSWDINKRITYTLTFGLDRIYWAPEVASWSDETEGAANMY